MIGPMNIVSLDQGRGIRRDPFDEGGVGRAAANPAWPRRVFVAVAAALWLSPVAIPQNISATSPDSTRGRCDVA